jgi:hypothetical protein
MQHQSTSIPHEGHRQQQQQQQQQEQKQHTAYMCSDAASSKGEFSFFFSPKGLCPVTMHGLTCK